MFEDEKELRKFIAEVTATNKSRRHRYYKQTVDHAEEMGVHVEGKSPIRLLQQKRPNEPEEIKKYRLDVWKNVTESMAGKVLHTIAKIFDPRLFRLEFPETPPIIPQQEDLQTYLRENFGVYKDLFIFIRETLLTKEMSDPNSLCVVIPNQWPIKDTEFPSPVPIIFPAKSVVDFVEGEWYAVYIKENKEEKQPEELWIINERAITVYTKIDGKWSVKKEFETGGQPEVNANGEEIENTNISFVPAFRLGGVIKGDRQPYWYKSFIYGVQPHWDKVVTMVSDLDGSIVRHLFPAEWEYSVECDTCHGEGNIQYEGANTLTPGYKVCNNCHGTGRKATRTPFGVYQIKPDALNPDVPIPTPPGGTIPRDIQPIQELQKLKDEEVLKGFEAINMEVLHRVGANQSGVAKTIDRADLNSMMLRIAQNIFDCNVKPIIFYTAIWRYREVLTPQQLMDYISGITLSKPADFNVLGTNILMEEYEAATNANVSDQYLKQLEAELVNTRFANNEEAKKKNLTIIQLKPFPSKTDDEVALGVANGTIKKETAIRNTNIGDLVNTAIEENPMFLDLEFKEKLDIVNAIIRTEFPEAFQEVTTQGIPVEDGGAADE